MTEKGNGSSGTRTLRKTFMEWQDEIEEEWLHRMSLEGWHLERVKPGIMHCKYYFNRGEPKNYVYRLDYPEIKDREDYLETFREAGWIHLERLPNGWEYFRTGEEAPPGENVEIYTDNSSRIEKYKRMLWFMLIFSGILLANIYNTFFTSTLLRVSGGILYPVILGFTAVTIPLILLLLYTVYKLLGRIKSLSHTL